MVFEGCELGGEGYAGSSDSDQRSRKQEEILEECNVCFMQREY